MTYADPEAKREWERKERGRERSRRKHAIKSRTEPLNRVPKRLHLVPIYSDAERRKLAAMPKTRGECEGGSRPCPYVRCKYNLYLDISSNGKNLKFNFPDLEPEDMPPERSCALDVADSGENTLEQVGVAMNMTRERVRQIEIIARSKVADQSEGFL